MTSLSRGANAPLETTSVRITVSGAAPGSVDLLVFQVAEDGKVRSDADMVFFNQPRSPEGAVQLNGAAVDIDLGRVPPQIARLVVSVALDDSVTGSLATIAGLGASVQAGGAIDCPATSLTSERAAVLAEIYRRGDAWKVRNVSAGWDRGLAALAIEFGVEVDDPAPPAAPPAPAGMPTVAPQTPPASTPSVAPAAPPVTMPTYAPPSGQPVPGPDPQNPRSVPGEEKLSLEKRQQLDLRKKQVHSVLLTKNAVGVRARVLVVMDKTGSMSREYKKGVVHRVIERMVPVAIQLDDDGALECYLYAESFYKLPDLRVENLSEWIAEWVHLSGKHGGLNYARIGAVNDEIPILNEIIGGLRRGDPLPTLVLFFTDGGFHKKVPITELIRKAADFPAFFQFVGIGSAGRFGVLEKLDDLEGRTVDNVGFFPVKDIDALDDGELYRLLLSEFPDWLQHARRLGIVG